MAGVRRAARGKWSSETGSAKGSANFPPSKRTADSPGARDAPADFKGLTPGAKARHGISVPASEQQAQKDGPVDYVQGSRGRLGSPSVLGGLRGRDVRAAAVARVSRKG